MDSLGKSIYICQLEFIKKNSRDSTCINEQNFVADRSSLKKIPRKYQ